MDVPILPAVTPAAWLPATIVLVALWVARRLGCRQ
jgi:hypothetical protein